MKDYREVILKHKSVIKDIGVFINEDTTLNNPKIYETAKLRVVLCFLSPFSVRCIALTEKLLYDIIKQNYGDDVFVDFAYFPGVKLAHYFVKKKIPLMIGVLTQKVISDFDVVLFSIATGLEILQIPIILKSIGIPVFASDRQKGSYSPILMGGGVVSIVDSLTGSVKIKGEEKRSFVDGLLFGAGEVIIPKIFPSFFKLKEEGKLKNQIEVARELDKYSFYLYPLAYEYEYEEKKPLKIKNVKVKDGFKKEVEYCVKYDINEKFYTTARNFFQSSAYSNYATIDIILSNGCSSGGSCSFCYLPYVQGSWSEKSYEYITKEIDCAIENSLPVSITFSSSNQNYYSRYIDILEYETRYLPRFSTFSMRADIIATEYGRELMYLLKKLGIKKITLGVEGFSERLRGFLNKNLNKEQLMNAIRMILENSVMLVKLNFINTGYEQKEDIEEFLEMMRDIIKLKEEMKAKTTFIVYINSLFYYPGTMIYRLKKENCYRDFYNEGEVRNYICDIIVELKKLDIKVKINQKGHSVLVEQFFLSAGRKATPLVYEYSINKHFWATNVCGRHIYEDFYNKLKTNYFEFSFDDIYGEMEEDENRIFPMLKHYLNEYNNRLYKELKSCGNVYDYKNKMYCLNTPVKEEMKKNGIKEVNKCYVCGWCKNKEEVKRMTERSLGNKYTIYDILTNIEKIKPTHFYIISANFKNYFVNKSSVIKHFLVKAIKNKKDFNDLFLINFPYLKYRDIIAFIDGKVYFLLKMNNKLEIDTSKINEFTTIYNVKYKEIKNRSYINIKLYNVFLVEVNDYDFKSKIEKFDYKVDINKRSRNVKIIEVEYNKEEIEYELFYYGMKQYFVFKVPFRVSPHEMMRSILKNDKVIYNYIFTNLVTIIKEDNVERCKICGEKTFIDLLNNKSPICFKCYAKYYIGCKNELRQDKGNN